MEKIKTYGQLKEHMLAVMDHADDDKPCKLNRSISKGRFWNMLFDCCTDKTANKECNDMIIKNALTEFPEYMRCDFTS